MSSVIELHRKIEIKPGNSYGPVIARDRLFSLPKHCSNLRTLSMSCIAISKVFIRLRVIHAVRPLDLALVLQTHGAWQMKSMFVRYHSRSDHQNEFGRFLNICEISSPLTSTLTRASNLY